MGLRILPTHPTRCLDCPAYVWFLSPCASSVGKRTCLHMPLLMPVLGGLQIRSWSSATYASLVQSVSTFSSAIAGQTCSGWSWGSVSSVRQDSWIGLFCTAVLWSVFHRDHPCWRWMGMGWITDNFAPGYLCTQTKLTGDLEDLFHEFQSTWSKSGKGMLTSPWANGRTFWNLLRHHAPPIPCSSPSLNAQSLANEIKRKKNPHGSRLGRGQANQQMPDTVRARFCDFSSLQKPMENGPSSSQRAEWPHWQSAHHPQEPLDFRPITVLSLRRTIPGIWLLLWMRGCPLTLMDPGVGAHAGHVWMNLLLAVESAQETATPLAGLVCDVVKALMRLPMHILVGWAGAVSQMARHLTFARISPVLLTAARVLQKGMDSLLWPWSSWTACCIGGWHMAHDLCRTLSYADDWQMLLKSLDLSQHHGEVREILFACWPPTWQKENLCLCLSRDGRKQLRQQGFIVGHGGRHLQLAVQYTNASLQGRVKSLGDMWDRLRLSHCPYKLEVAAWPRGLHGVTSTCLGSQILAWLRSGAMRGRAADGPGSIGYGWTSIMWSCFWSVMQSVIRDCAVSEVIQSFLTQCVFHQAVGHPIRSPGPCSHASSL